MPFFHFFIASLAVPFSYCFLVPLPLRLRLSGFEPPVDAVSLCAGAEGRACIDRRAGGSETAQPSTARHCVTETS